MSGFSIGNGLSTGSGLSAGSGFSRGGGFYFNGFSATPTPTLDLNFTTMTALPSTITFSRPSNATYYDSTGKLTYAPNNQVTFSEQFDNAAWPKADVTVTANATTAPNGTTTADKLIATATNANHLLNRVGSFPVAVGAVYIFSLYAKAAEYNFVRVQLQQQNFPECWANFNLLTGAVGLTQGPVTTSIQSVGDGWYRCSITATATATGNNGVQPFVLDSNRGGSSPFYLGDGTSGIFIWGAQFEAVTYQTTPSTYVATTSAAYYGPRLDYDPVTLAPRGLLIEEARTNSYLFSDQFNGASTTGANVTANTSVSPDGRSSADTITAAVGSGIHNVYAGPLAVTASVNYAQSIFAKKGTSRFIYITTGNLGSAGYATAIFDLDGGGSGATQTSVGGTPLGTITSTGQESVGNGWFRLSVVSSIPASSRYVTVGLAGAATGNTITAEGNASFTAIGTETIYVWGMQFELGSFPTSYIPTFGSFVARAADTATMTGANFSSWYSQSEGTFVASAQTGTLVTNTYAISVNDGSTSEFIGTRLTGAASASAYVIDNGSIQFAPTGAAISLFTTVKWGLAYKVNDFALSVNGGAPETDAAGSLPTPNRATFGGATSTAGQTWVSSLAYYPQRLPNATLQSLTS